MRTPPQEVTSDGRKQSEASPFHREGAAKPRQSAGKKSVVAVASSDEQERARWVTMLEAAGHGVIEAPTTLLLLELAQAQQTDLVICSVGSGPVDGYELLEGIRREARTASLPCLLTSADPSDWRRSMAKGADDFLAVPVVGDDLVEAVSARLERQRTMRELAARTAFHGIPAELLELVVKKAPVAEILQRIASQLERGLGAITVVPRLCHGERWETLHASGFSARSWPQLDRLIGKLLQESGSHTNPARKEMVLPVSSSLLLFFANQKVNQKPGGLWHVPVRGEDGSLLGCFEIFLALGKDSARWTTGANRAALDPIFRLASVLMGRQQQADELTRQTHFDSVTGLPNRREFDRHLEEACRRGEQGGTEFAVACLDIERFQRINDTYGYDVADRLLSEFATRLRRQCRSPDLTARISGDEFALVIPDPPQRGKLQSMIERAADTLMQPYLIEQHRIIVRVTAGISVFPADGTQPADLLARAEAALATARSSTTHGPVALFERKAPAPVIDGMDLESYLEHALAVNGFVLHYQPIYRNRGGCIGYEALVRLRRGLQDKSPDQCLELVPPGIFLPAAEESGLILPIGEWVFDEACRQMRAWLDTGFHCPRIAVNLSARQLSQSDLVETFAASMAKHSIVDPGMLELELTETVVIDDHLSGKRRLNELKQLGLRIAIDDFGIGYSSLSYLNSFPADVIKIDQSFVRKLGTPPVDADPSWQKRCDPSLPVIGAILSLANNLGAEVVAEGVETPEQYRILSSAGCHEFQGFLFAHPMEAGTLQVFMEKHLAWTTDHFASHHARRSG